MKPYSPGEPGFGTAGGTRFEACVRVESIYHGCWALTVSGGMWPPCGAQSSSRSVPCHLFWGYLKGLGETFQRALCPCVGVSSGQRAFQGHGLGYRKKSQEIAEQGGKVPVRGSERDGGAFGPTVG